MSYLPSLTAIEIIRILNSIGFHVKRIKGSHHILKHPDNRTTVIPVHKGETIGPGLLTKILKDCKLTKEEFKELL
ncbi:MAG: type II toxin-antitoxin system HicA family toxin [Ignavibacteriae bacterium]|nr:type II toxin-antitoxin system HicA family toxin [Ignavibacteriota bacterium]